MDEPQPTSSTPVPARRSPFAQTLLLLAAVAIGITSARHIYAARPPRLTCSVTRTLATQAAEPDGKPPRDLLLVAVVVRIDNPRDRPITLNNLTLTFTGPDNTGSTALQAEREQLPALESVNPALPPLLDRPIFRNTRVEPGKTTQGTVLFPIAIAPAAWSARRRTRLTLNFNHTGSVTVSLP